MLIVKIQIKQTSMTTDSKKILGVIPARYASRRFPAKPLIDIGGKSMIRRVYEQAKKSNGLSRVIVATDHQDIHDHVIGFGGEVCMTAEHHASGTDRCCEVLGKQQESFDYLVNVQGDEPFISPEQIDLLITQLNGKTEVATLMRKIETTEELFNPNIVKVITKQNKEAIYFSRATLPNMRNLERSDWLKKNSFYKHIGLYAYRTDILQQITKLPVSLLEKAESLEQLRWLENGIKIKVAETHLETISIDTPEDLQKALLFLKLM
jgi:3-deoxy-manno-octulosonate cytidylyltransferase (CMP-KDO synthetase)